VAADGAEALTSLAGFDGDAREAHAATTHRSSPENCVAALGPPMRYPAPAPAAIPGPGVGCGGHGWGNPPGRDVNRRAKLTSFRRPTLTRVERLLRGLRYPISSDGRKNCKSAALAAEAPYCLT
jgi:hypothetical protein